MKPSDSATMTWDNAQNGCDWMSPRITDGKGNQLPGCRKVFKNHRWPNQAARCFRADFADRSCSGGSITLLSSNTKSINDLQVWGVNPKKKATNQRKLPKKAMISGQISKNTQRPAHIPLPSGLPCDPHGLKRQSTGLHRTHLAERF